METLPPALTDWLSEALGDPGPFTVMPFGGGNSNETLLLRTPRADRVLRRPPAATIAPSAHSMEREHRILAALEGTGVPAPRPLAFCADSAVAPAPFLVMELVEGVSLTDELPEAYPAPVRAAKAIGEAVIDALAALHGVDWRAHGLTDFGKPDGFLERQVPRWRGQYERYQVRELPMFDAVAAWLEQNRPPGFEPGIMHGDFHLDNCLLSPRPPIRVRAIIDWETATIGDPLMDLGLFLVLWGPDRPPSPAMPRVQAVTRVEGAPTRRELAERYAAATGRDISHLPYYCALSAWKLAAIVEGAYAHFVAGNVDSAYARGLAHDVPALLDEAGAIAGLAPRLDRPTTIAGRPGREPPRSP